MTEETYYSNNDESFDYDCPSEALQAVYDDRELEVGDVLEVQESAFISYGVVDALPHIMEGLKNETYEARGDWADPWDEKLSTAYKKQGQGDYFKGAKILDDKIQKAAVAAVEKVLKEAGASMNLMQTKPGSLRKLNYKFMGEKDGEPVFEEITEPGVEGVT